MGEFVTKLKQLDMNTVPLGDLIAYYEEAKDKGYELSYYISNGCITSCTLSTKGVEITI